MAQQQKSSRRTLIKLMGVCGASSAVTSVFAWSTPTSADDEASKNGIKPFYINVSDEELEELDRLLSDDLY